jgi:hypothetical protein
MLGDWPGHAARAAVLLVVSASESFAYIDPGTGSYLFQLLIAGGLGLAYTARLWIRWVASIRQRLFGRRTTPAVPRDGVA